MHASAAKQAAAIATRLQRGMRPGRRGAFTGGRAVAAPVQGAGANCTLPGQLAMLT